MADLESVIPGMQSSFQSQEAPSIARSEMQKELASEANAAGKESVPPADADGNAPGAPSDADVQPGADAEGQQDVQEYVPAPEVLMRAAVQGLTLEDCKAFGSDEALGKHIELAARFAPRQPQAPQAPAGFQQVPEPKPEAAPVKWYEMPDLSEYGIDDSVTKAIAGMNEHNKSAFTGLQSELQGMRQLVEAQHQAIEMQRMAQTEAQFEQAVNALSEPWAADALGKGDAEDIKPEQLQNRIKLFDAMMRLAAVNGSEKKSPRRLVAEAVGLVPEFRALISKAGKAELVAKVQGQNKIRRPNLSRTSQNAPAESALDFAKREVAARTGRQTPAPAFAGTI